jgi:hypothetical protein
MINPPLDDALAAALSAQAAAQGLSIEVYLQQVLLAPQVVPPRMSVEELDRILDAEASFGPSPAGSFSRSELYSDHD